MVNVVEVVNPIQLPQADQLELVRLPRYASLDTVDWCRISCMMEGRPYQYFVSIAYKIFSGIFNK